MGSKNRRITVKADSRQKLKTLSEKITKAKKDWEV
jgi:hypothetical protein